MKLERRKKTLGGALVVAGALALAAMTFGVPGQVGGCGGLPEAEEEGAAIDGALTGARTAPPMKLLIVWDGPDGTGWKLGEVNSVGGTFSLVAPARPPRAALADGAFAVAHLVALPAGKTIPDGPLSGDDADGLAQTALGALSGTALIYKAKESPAYPWLAAFPLGISCAAPQQPPPNARMAGGAALQGFARVGCRGLKPALAPVDEPAFSNWSQGAPAARLPPPQP